MAEWADGWAPLTAAVGTDFGAGMVTVGPDAVEAGAIRRFIEPIEMDCPLHVDREVARAHGFGDLVAPVSSLVTFTIPPLWCPGDPPIFTAADPDAQPARTSIGPRETGLEPPTTGFFAAESAADYVRPVVVGDRLARLGLRLVGCVPKETSVGRGAFVTWESEVRNQRDELVARLRTTSYSYEPWSDGRAVRPEPKVASVLPSSVPVEPIDWDDQRWWEDVEAEQPVPPVAFPLSVFRLVMAAGSNRDFNSIHHNSSWARATGAPDMYANVLFLQGMWERTVRQFIGLDGSIRSVAGFRMGSFNTVGDTVMVSGKVCRTWLEDGDGLVELAVWSANRHGVSVGPGRVVVSLPRRSARRRS